MKIHDPSQVASDLQIVTQRVVPYPAARIFEAFRDPTQLARWWGPSGFTNTFYEFDFREGGMWRFTMHSPDGTDYANECRFLRIVSPNQVVLDHTCAPYFQAHLSFEDTENGCLIDWHMIFNDAQTCAAVAKIAGKANEQNLDRLLAVIQQS
ncbi:MAG: SRPBCC family protein [Pirellulales bacterium]